MFKKELLTILALVAFLFVAIPLSAQENHTMDLSFGQFEFEKSFSNDRYFTLHWRIDRHIGDGYDGQTAHEMMQWAISQSSADLYLERWHVHYGDENYIYGYGTIYYLGTQECNLTITGLNLGSGPSTVSFKMIPSL